MPRGTGIKETPEWRRGNETPPGVFLEFVGKVRGIDGVSDATLLRPSILVVTTNIDDRPGARTGMEAILDPAAWALQVEASRAQRNTVFQLMKSIWQLDIDRHVRFLFITDDDV